MIAMELPNVTYNYSILERCFNSSVVRFWNTMKGVFSLIRFPNPFADKQQVIS